MEEKDLRRLKGRYAVFLERDCYDSRVTDETMNGYGILHFDSVEVRCHDKRLCGRWTQDFLFIRFKRWLKGLEIFEHCSNELSIMRGLVSDLSVKLEAFSPSRALECDYQGQGVDVMWQFSNLTFGYLKNLSQMEIMFSPLKVLKRTDTEFYNVCTKISYRLKAKGCEGMNLNPVGQYETNENLVRLGGGRTTASCISNARRHVGMMRKDLELLEQHLFEALVDFKKSESEDNEEEYDEQEIRIL